MPSMTRLDWIHGCYTGQCKVALGPCLAKNLLVDLRRSSKTLVGHGPFILVPCLAKTASACARKLHPWNRMSSGMWKLSKVSIILVTFGRNAVEATSGC